LTTSFYYDSISLALEKQRNQAQKKIKKVVDKDKTT